MSTARIAAKTNHWYEDGDGRLTRLTREDETVTDKFDFSDRLRAEGDDTISAAEWLDVSGPTLASTTVAAGDGGANRAVTVSVTKSGTAVLKVTTVGGLVLEQPIHWRPSDESIASRDYR